MLLFARGGRRQVNVKETPTDRDEHPFRIRYKWSLPRTLRGENKEDKLETSPRMEMHSPGIRRSSTCLVTFTSSTSSSSHHWRPRSFSLPAFVLDSNSNPFTCVTQLLELRKVSFFSCAVSRRRHLPHVHDVTRPVAYEASGSSRRTSSTFGRHSNSR
jgi:hypothetical protein